MQTFVSLLRGINVGGHNKIPMADLRSLCSDLGWMDVQSYIQSGNLVFQSGDEPPRLEATLEQAIEERFGFPISVVVRPAERWASYLQNNPFPDASEEEPNRVMLALSKAPPAPDAVENLRERAVSGERIELVEEVIWIHFKNGVGKSKLSPALLDRIAGSPVTMRNWRTLLKIDELIPT